MTTQPGAEAKRPRSVVAGPYGHPFHPALVTIPIGAWVSSLVLDIASIAGDNAALAEASRWLIGIGVLGALLAAVFGTLDLTTIPRGTPAFSTGIRHMVLNLLAVAVFAASFMVRTGNDPVPVMAVVLSVAGVALIGISGWLGAKLAYTYGVRVADERTRAGGFH